MTSSPDIKCVAKPRSKLVWAFCAFTLLLPNLVWSEVRELIIAYEDKQQPPYYLENSSQVPDEFPGLAVELVQRVDEKIPRLSIRLVRAPWSRCLSGLASNQYDGIFNASYQPERLNIGWYPTVDGSHLGELNPDQRLTRMAYSLYRRADSSLRWDGEQLTGSSEALKAIGAPAGYSIVQDLERLGLAAQEVPGSSNALLMLQLGRIEGAVLQEVTADAALSKMQTHFGRIVKEYPPLEEKDYFLMLSHRLVAEDPELAQEIWQTLAEVRENYEQSLRQKYRKYQKYSARLKP